ncbi:MULTISPECIES: pyridoxal phosphate-dependent aminotransferase [unclassified Rhodococcus (in: high G+C Gram-positive bacteria)]|uniref:pyridoxal phosphate-dependent aminotransferase n=1 Tax=unclassified Rhodococcus (in: high G+C Gram-positive bacteria) TaxID=192944 RepID=UPI0007BB441A|nr:MULTISPECIES: pyridoxal phosphate-dependent aminotransferase [unclassified Rhodococcus (in: high G+C Gram-positive bacteria)]KZF04680.1 aminotransferase [Rhodococcus sp. EPR-279]KZF08570.1 aminotransferase [Rhodococcus sp. EPR-147]
MSELFPSRTVARLRPFASTIFAEMTALAVEKKAVNLGQGFPDTDGPPAMLETAREAIASGLNQYSPGPGMPVLRAAIADDRAARFGLRYDPDSQILVTVGATEAISATLLGLIESGDDVLLIEPFYDSYAAAIALAGATRTAVPLVSDGNGWTVDTDALEHAIGPRTRMLIVNSPHNPTGTVFDRDTMIRIADIAVTHDLLVLTDEVYEHLTFDGTVHTPIATLPGMFERTVTVSSAAKTFNATGWKTGWALGPAELIDAVRAAKQFMTFVGGTPFQPAVAYALEHEQAWIAQMRDGLQRKRDTLSAALAATGADVKYSAGTYFVCADIAPIGRGDAYEFCRALPDLVGVAAVPVTAFVHEPTPWKSLVRFAFCKQDKVLADAAERLRKL